MKKRLLASVLSVVMLLSLLPATALAAGNIFEVSSDAEFVEALNTINLAEDGEYVIKLTNDIVLSTDCEFTANTITILGEGHSITGGANSTLKVGGNAVLNLGQEGYEKSLVFDGGTNPPVSTLVVASGESTLNMYDNVTIQNQAVLGGEGGVQLNNKATFNMYGGLITNCKDIFGGTAGGVGVGSWDESLGDACTFNMYGGTISNCSGGSGGGVRIGKNGTMTMSGGTIRDCTGYYGGGVFVNKASFTMTGGTIQNCSAAYYGGGILLYGSTASAIQDCTITGNRAKIGGGILLRENSNMDMSGSNHIVCNNTATIGGADIFLKGEDDTITLFDAAGMNQTYGESGKEIDGWYCDDPQYIPSEGAEPVGVSAQLKGQLALVASYKVTPVTPVTPQATVSYDLNGVTAPDGENYDPETVVVNKTVTAKPAPTKADYVFTGWSDGTNTYYAGQQIPVPGDMTLTAQWQDIASWSEPPEGGNGGKLDVSVDVKVDVDVDVEVDIGVQANAQVTDGTEALADNIRDALVAIMRGRTPPGMTDTQAAALRALLNQGASKLEAKLTVYVTLENTPTKDDLKKLLGEAFDPEEQAQEWDLSVKLTTTAKDAADAAIDEVADVPISETSPITFTLTTGKNLSGEDVRVLYQHNGKVGIAASRMTNASDGVVTVTASQFSPYVILSKAHVYSGGSGSGSSPTAYPITVINPENGTLTSDKSAVTKGTTVTITALPEKGYELDKLTVTDKDGKTISVTAKGGGKYTFTMPASKVTVAASFAETDQTLAYRDCLKDETCPIWPFTDAKTTDWYHDGVHFCIENKLMRGYGNDVFKPNAETTRAMITVMLWRLNGSPVVNYALHFEDVQPDRWYTEGIRWADSEGIAQGYGNGTFGPDDVVTREQMAAILWRYAKDKGYDVSVGEDTNILSYDDAACVAQYAIPAMQWACGSGMVVGKAQNGGMILDPGGSTTRAQMATMMMRFCAEIVK